jgi:uncharacterized protein (TIGR00369 family)
LQVDSDSEPVSQELRRIFDQAPFIADLGVRLQGIGLGECETVLELERRHLQQDGFVHAGVQAALADHTAGAAAATLVGPSEYVLTVEFKINLLRPARGDRLRCRATVLKPGARIDVVESEVWAEVDGETRLVSKALVTLVVLAREPRE